MAETIIAAIGGAIVSGLINLISGFIFDLVAGLIENLITGQGDVTHIFEEAWEFVVQQVEALAHNAINSLGEVAGASINAGAEALKGVLGVVDAQTDLMESLQYGAEHYYDDLLAEMKAQQATELQTGAALSDFAFRLIAEQGDMLQTAGETFFGTLEAGVSEERFGTTNYAAAMLGQVQEWLVADLMMVENLSHIEGKAAAQMVIEIAQVNIELVREWFTELVAKPIAYGSNMAWALRSVAEMDPEVFKEQLLGSVRASWEVYQEILAKGYTPPG